MIASVLHAALVPLGLGPLHLVDAKTANKRGAVCLDGSPPGFWMQNASSAADSKRWVLYMQGGAWCGSPSSCASRTRSHLGNSSQFPPSWPIEGVLDANLQRNPTFGSWNLVLLAYCDGGSFSGDAAAGLPWPDPRDPKRNMTLYFRGRRVVHLLIDTLSEQFGMDAASEVMLAGGSAGGLATFLQADFVGGLLRDRGVRKYRAVPVSGFFLDHPTLRGERAFAASMNATYTLHNASVSAECRAGLPSSEAWRCFLANYSYAFARTPMFPIQSSLDEYQLFAILQAGGWDQGCLNRGQQFANCTEAQLADFKAYASALLSAWGSNLTRGKAARPGEGAFIESCLEHVAEQYHAMFDGYAIGGTSMQQALSRWWASDGSEPAAAHTFRPCELSVTPPRQCNPSCFAHSAEINAESESVIESA
jgi:hypothetical protein